ncbi:MULTISPECIES: YjbH domain-containing protein [Actibacterium]|uniref:Exopolysaccharide biosynthesis protein YbjH n=1 Tax=Actibacterium naphthalenivorans TaxID=1614693 RepID=A0A840C9G3_9RHOB|nr:MULTISPECIES: YjbH domain-containing protein [Actibacterium]ALG91643.1 outer membrane lipoprotein [Actibacterium sp. EMB200-NS6]MBB4021720.1 hypothetical protein [Actibacterium naphthalenivorans]
MTTLEQTGAGRRRFARGGALLIAALALPRETLADTPPAGRPTLNFYGVTGLIDMPTAQSQPDGQLSLTVSNFAGLTRTTLTFQISSRLSGSFRYTGTKDLNYAGFRDYYDRSFDARYRLLDEGRYLPDFTVGLQDFAGTGVSSAEYLVATKHLRPNLTVTAGLGWGRLGTYESFGSPFGDRPRIEEDTGGDLNADLFFRGPAAPFAGVEWQPTDRLGLKAEYSSDAYTLETRQKVFEHKSPWNFGMEYQASEYWRVGAYYLYGSEIGINAQFSFNPRNRPGGGDFGVATYPVQPRPDRATNPDAWTEEWVLQPDGSEILRANTAALLNEAGLTLEAMAVSADRVQLWLRNLRYDNNAEAIGRAARILTRTMPPSVETFEIVPVEQGIPAAKVTLRRTDVETLENAPNGAARLRSVADISAAHPTPPELERADELYPRFNWSLNPYLQQELFDPAEPYRADLSLRLSAEYEFAPGLALSGSLTKRLFGTLDEFERPNNSVLPHVRTETPRYVRDGDPGIETLTMAWYSHPARDLYGRVTAGYLERMFGGVSAELLWKPVNSRLGLGAEVNRTRQRDFDGMFGFQDYEITTGHLSAYYDFGSGYQAQVDAGRYLAGDWGSTLTLERVFANGWRVGGFATLTDVSAEEFGEGSFDKGIFMVIPMSWLTGKPSRAAFSNTVRPITRDGGARLAVNGRLFGLVNGYHRERLDTQWGKVWR